MIKLKTSYHTIMDTAASNPAESAICHLVDLTLVVSTFVLTKRLEKCAPAETKNQSNTRQSAMVLSGTVIGLMLLMPLTAGIFPSLGKFQAPVQLLKHVLVAIVAILNIVYISAVNTETCSSGAVNSADVMGNKNLSLFVLVLSAVALVALSKKLMWHAGNKVARLRSARRKTAA